ncbi:MAG: YdcF family protein [Paenibacillus sp.]|uniref:YdcF family protein n=1 Tax=Paenibacillus sp. TaxID=58172 RepID=UPI0025CEDFC4|nr:YdcF family protein [Paenibacillus sp.]MBR2566809.1 YdcF family protein [Paenibacillus sp.]
MNSSRPVKRSSMTRTKRRVLLAVVFITIFFIIWTGITVQGILSSMHESSSRSSDAAIVLGAAVEGEDPSPVFRERIEQAIRLYTSGRVDNLIFTGGSRNVAVPAEAHVGRKYAIEHGVRPEHIQIETKSITTQENLEYSLEIGNREGYRTYTIVSDPLHMKRSMKMATEMGMDVVPSPTQTTAYKSWSTRIPFLIRETVMYMAYTIKGWN